MSRSVFVYRIPCSQALDKVEDAAVVTSPYLEMLGEHRSLTQVRRWLVLVDDSGTVEC